ncbi:MAG: DEAD/DEAH box helicase [Actinomycetota bacterium]|nr:DEAD/DEAH box helicase [Actinomycetota bacterium]
MFSDRVAAILQGRNGLSVEEIACELFGPNMDEPEIERVIEATLFAGHHRYQRSRSRPWLWSLVTKDADGGSSEPTSAENPRYPVSSHDGRRAAIAHARELLPTPYSWQLEALQAWDKAGRRGIVEAVTGSGKTLVGMLAMFASLEEGAKVHIVVPTIDLQRQWFTRIHGVLPSQITVGRRGGGYSSSLESVDVLISVVNSARGGSSQSTDFRSHLIIADECHRFGVKRNFSALGHGFQQRLGLSATYHRDDNGHTKFLLPYFERVCYSLNYDRAHLDGVIADFGVVFVGVDLSGEESTEYQYLSDEIFILLKTFRRLMRIEFPDYSSLISALLDSVAGKYFHRDERIEHVAKAMLARMRERRRLLESASGKLDALVALGPEILASHGTVVFTQSIEVAIRAESALNGAGIRARAIHSRTDRDVRKYHIRKFGEGDLRAIIAPRILDEGIDFPDADFAVVMASSSTRRQMIQRMGRILRPKHGGRLARFAVLFAQATVEDPRYGAHGIFRQDVFGSAKGLEIILSDDYPHALAHLESLRVAPRVER